MGDAETVRITVEGSETTGADAGTDAYADDTGESYEICTEAAETGIDGEAAVGAAYDGGTARGVCADTAATVGAYGVGTTFDPAVGIGTSCGEV